MPRRAALLQIKRPPLWSTLLRKSATCFRAEHLFAMPVALMLLHVPWHMQKVSFVCLCCMRSLVLCLQVTDLYRSHTCSGFDPPEPHDTGTGALQQLQPLTLPPGSTGAPSGLMGRALRRHSDGRCAAHIPAAIFGSLLGMWVQGGELLPWCSCCA